MEQTCACGSREANCGKVCLYTLRHSFITQAVTDGMTTLDLSARLCGTSVSMIEKYHGHPIADAARKPIEAVFHAFRQQGPLIRSQYRPLVKSTTQFKRFRDALPDPP